MEGNAKKGIQNYKWSCHSKKVHTYTHICTERLSNNDQTAKNRPKEEEEEDGKEIEKVLLFEICKLRIVVCVLCVCNISFGSVIAVFYVLHSVPSIHVRSSSLLNLYVYFIYLCAYLFHFIPGSTSSSN